MVPVVRSLVSFAAGVARMPLGPFILFTALGSLPWTFLLVFAGMQLGANWETIGGVLKRFEYAVLARARRRRPRLDLVPDHPTASPDGLTSRPAPRPARRAPVAP